MGQVEANLSPLGRQISKNELIGLEELCFRLVFTILCDHVASSRGPFALQGDLGFAQRDLDLSQRDLELAQRDLALQPT